MKREATALHLRGVLVELLWLVPVSAVAGFVIGTAQHFVGFGVWGYGFRMGPLELALLEGGLLGAAVGVPTGVVAYYTGLQREASFRRVLLVIVGTLFAGCLLGVALFWVSAFATPFAAVAVAYWVARQVPARAAAAAPSRRQGQ